MGFWSSLAGKILDPLGVHRIFEKHAKSPKKVSGGFTMRSADSMHGLIVAAGQGNAAAKGQLDAIKAAAAKGDPAALKLMKYITPIARMVERNLGSPSMLAQRQGARRPVGTQTAALQKAQNQIKAMRQAQIERVKKEAFHKQVQTRFQQERGRAQAFFAQQQAKYDAEIQAYDDKLVEAQKQLEKQGWDDNTRKQLEAQAQGYEAMIDKLTAAKEQVAEAAAVAAPAETAPEAAAPAEAAPAEEAPAGEPGDVEIEE